MAERARRLTIGRRFSLAAVAEGWQDCYLLYRPATPRDVLLIKSTDVTKFDRQQASDFSMQFIIDHFESGVALVGGQLAPMQAEDLEELPDEVLGELYMTILGVQLDPKDIPTVQPASNEPLSAASSTKTSSSTESTEQPTQTS